MQKILKTNLPVFSKYTRICILLCFDWLSCTVGRRIVAKIALDVTFCGILEGLPGKMVRQTVLLSSVFKLPYLLSYGVPVNGFLVNLI